MTWRPEQLKARAYLDQKGSRLPIAEIRQRVAAAFAAIEERLASVREPDARARFLPGEWTVQEVVDHLIETHRPSIVELRDLLAGRRPAGEPIPAGLQSAEPLKKPWGGLVAELHMLHAEVLEVLASASDRIVTDARAPIVMVINAEEPGGRVTPLHWIEELDWKAYAIVFRLHVLDHLRQVDKTLAAARGAA